MIAPARLAAYDILSAISNGRSDLPTALARARAQLSDERDRALAAEIATGVQRWRLTLDHLIGHFAKRPISRIDEPVVEILRMGAYQLLHLFRVPASAVVDDAVEMSRKVGKRSASGFVNAILRSISRSRGKLPLPQRPDDESNREAAIEYLSTTLSHPRWLAERWYDRLGLSRAEQWMLFNNRHAPLTLRANRFRVSAGDLSVRLAALDTATHPGRFAPDALIVESGQPLHNPGTASGLFVVQDEASQLVTLLAGDDPGDLVLDACASPGGKATAIAAAIEGRGRVVACDVRRRRMGLLQKTVAATGAGNVWLVQANTRASLPFGSAFSCVIVDAPCSGLGTLRRDPDIKWRRREADLEPLAAAQHAMIDRAADAVRAGGRLVYATCSTEPEENEQVVDRFLEEHPGFVPVQPETICRAWPSTIADERGHLRTSPDRHELEGFFGAVFERTGQL